MNHLNINNDKDVNKINNKDDNDNDNDNDNDDRFIKLLDDKYNKNIKAFIYTYDHKKHRNTYCNNFINPLEIDDNTIIIYPEVISGNPLNCKHVIRWILLELGYEMPKNHYNTWNKNDFVFSWEPNKTVPQLCCPWIDKNILEINYEVKDKKQNNSAYMLRKMQHIEEIKSYTKFFHPDDSVDLDKLSHQEIIKVFLKSSKFYSYDPNTFYNLIAPLCGCITVLHPIPGLSKDEYLRNRITNNGEVVYDAGISYGTEPSEIQNAFDTLHLAKQQMQRLISYYDSNIDSFLLKVKEIIKLRIRPTNTVASIYYNNTYHKCQY
jgi:hypothetical protein